MDRLDSPLNRSMGRSNQNRNACTASGACHGCYCCTRILGVRLLRRSAKRWLLQIRQERGHLSNKLNL